MIWNDLIDRCLLFTDAPKVLLKELLKEAEREMSVKCDIYEDELLFTYSDSSENNYLVLPRNFKRVTALYINGTKIARVDEADLSLDTDNKFRDATPTGY